MCTAPPPSPLFAAPPHSPPVYLEELAPASPQPSFRPPGPSADRSPAAVQPNFACEVACAGPPARDLHVLFHGPSDPRPGTPCPRPVT